MKTHIYKVYRAAASTLLLTAALAACTDNSREPMQENETPREGIFFSVTAMQGEGAETRVSYEPNGDQGMNVTWATDDKIYVGKLPLSSYNSISGILSPLDIATGGAGQTTAHFNGTIANEHLPNSGETLYAVYGKADKIGVDYGNIRCDYTGQRQTANGNMTHAAEYDFMKASTEYNATPGFQHRFSFSHVGSMMKFTLGGLENQTVNKLTLGTYDESWPFAGDNESVSLELGTGSGFLVESGKKLDAYLMVGATTETVGKNLVLYVTTTEGKNFATLLTGAEIAAGKLYTVDTTLTEYGLAGTGEQGNPYQITDAGDLTKLAVMTNTGMMDTQGQYFQLTTDINMAGEEAWVPIGTNYNNTSFQGTFSGENGSGGNYSITNLPGKRTYIFAGLFGSLSGATIKNVTVSGEITISGADEEVRAGGIAGEASNSTIEGCVSNCTISISSTQYVSVGGIIGDSPYGGNNVTNCQNQGNISSSRYSGGIFGYAGDNDKITSCTNTGNITSTNAAYPAGGIIGRLYLSATGKSFTLTDCTHSGGSPASNTAGSIIGSYVIGKRYSGTAAFSTITITNSGSSKTITGSAERDVKGQWPEAAIN